MKKVASIIIGCITALIILFVSIDPNKMPSFFLILPFVLIFILLFAGVSFILMKAGVTSLLRIRIAAISAAFPVLLLVLQSIGQLTARDILAVVILFALSYFYVLRMPTSS